MNTIRHEWDLPEIGLRRLSALDMRRFWDGFIALRPGIRYGWGNVYSRWRGVPGTELNLSLYITNHSVGLLVRGRRGTPLSVTRAGLQPRARDLERALGAEVHAEALLLRNLPLATRLTLRAGAGVMNGCRRARGNILRVSSCAGR